MWCAGTCEFIYIYIYREKDGQGLERYVVTKATSLKIIERRKKKNKRCIIIFENLSIFLTRNFSLFHEYNFNNNLR